jgi:hypothetical protein
MDCDLVRAIADATEKEGTLLVGGRLLRRGRLQMDVSSYDGSSCGIDYDTAKVLRLGAAVLCSRVSTDAQRCAKKYASPSIHVSASTYKARIAAGARTKQ